LSLVFSASETDPAFLRRTYADETSAFADDGVSIVRRFVSRKTVSCIAEAFAGVKGRPGQRGFALTADVRGLIAPAGAIGQLAAFFAERAMSPVRVLFFDKTAETNWSVPWHQDRTIAVRERVDAPGFSNWSVKNDVSHVEPPISLLENMLTLRLFLDDCNFENGPLQVACRTHGFGRIASRDVAQVALRSRRIIATGEAGDVLAMRLLSLHKSDRAANPTRRRVLHVDYAGGDLPKPLQWWGEPLER
jgi:hypothetical protein